MTLYLITTLTGYTLLAAPDLEHAKAWAGRYGERLRGVREAEPGVVMLLRAYGASVVEGT